MLEARFANAALNDLLEIDACSVTKSGSEVAAKHTNGFTAAFQRLEQFPEPGAARPELCSDTRCLKQRQQRILYRFMPADLLILRIVHHAMDLARMQLTQ